MKSMRNLAMKTSTNHVKSLHSISAGLSDGKLAGMLMTN